MGPVFSGVSCTCRVVSNGKAQGDLQIWREIHWLNRLRTRRDALRTDFGCSGLCEVTTVLLGQRSRFEMRRGRAYELARLVVLMYQVRASVVWEACWALWKFEHLWKWLWSFIRSM